MRKLEDTGDNTDRRTCRRRSGIACTGTGPAPAQRRLHPDLAFKTRPSAVTRTNEVRKTNAADGRQPVRPDEESARMIRAPDRLTGNRQRLSMRRRNPTVPPLAEPWLEAEAAKACLGSSAVRGKAFGVRRARVAPMLPKSWHRATPGRCGRVLPAERNRRTRLELGKEGRWLRAQSPTAGQTIPGAGTEPAI
jgi:hypothetical protein